VFIDRPVTDLPHTDPVDGIGRYTDMGDDALRSAQSPTRPEEPEKHYTLQEAAEELGVDVAELHLAIKANILACSHHYGRSLVTPTEIERYRQRTKPGPDTKEDTAASPQSPT
jgi:hypothetical protein